MLSLASGGAGMFRKKISRTVPVLAKGEIAIPSFGRGGS
jgi:hypothetical protein